MSKFYDDMKKDIQDNIRYKNTIMTGEITKVNNDGTYDVKIAQSNHAYPDVETVNYNTFFNKGEIVDIAFEYGTRESPKILGTAKKIAQEPTEVEVDYSGEDGGGKQTITTTLYAILQPNGSLCRYGNAQDDSYNKCHDSVDGSDLGSFAINDDTTVAIGQRYAILDTNTDYWIQRGYILINTSSIPVDAAITNAILSFYIPFPQSIDTHFNVVVQNGQPNYPHNPVIASDYDCSKYNNNGGQINTSSISVTYNDITLNSNGRAWINKGGMTKFCLRSSKDIAEIAPSLDEANLILIDQITDAIKLEITYEY